MDKYAGRRDGAGDRGHYKADGTPKVPMTREDAERAAVSLTFAEEQPVYAYECPVCAPVWHCGRRRDEAEA